MYRIILGIFLLCLNGCASFPKGSSQLFQLPWQQHVTMLQDLTHFEFAGKIAVIRNNEATTANILWQQDNDSFNIELAGPMQINAARLTGNQQQVTIYGKDNLTQTANTAEDLLQQNFGWSIPVTGLKTWILGLPYKNAAITKQQTDQFELLSSLEQQNWQISYGNYLSYGKLRLPTKITLLRKENNSYTKVKIIVRYWLLPKK